MTTKEDQVSSLIEEAYEHLDQSDYKVAVKIGKKLKKLRHSSAFEILALAYAGEEKTNKAIKALKEGVQKAPDAWSLWQLLGNYYSDEGSFEQSYEAYERALNCPRADISSVHLNYAIALKRNKKYPEALKHLDKVVSKETYLYSQCVQLEILNLSSQYDQAIRLASQLLKQGPKPEDFENHLPTIYVELGSAYWKSSEQTETALQYAWKAIAFDKQEKTAQWLIREIESQYSASSKYYRILVEGLWHEPLDDDTSIPGFFINYDVVAENEEEVLMYIKRFEPEVVHNSLKIEGIKILEESPNQPKGVYTVSGYMYFVDEDE
ncbi:MAG: tetratricopeptide repeat protein [Planctomycetota bacterium]|jgi:tetratricopeptide (TPR) repeat protein